MPPIRHLESQTAPRLLTHLHQHTLSQAFSASCFIALAAQIKVPCYPVPATMQDWAIMLVALLATRRVAVSAVLLFLSYAIIGLPVLSSGAAGLSLFFGPTAGYLAGFILMAATMATLKERYLPGNFGEQLWIVLAGNVVLFAAGLSWLGYLMGWELAFKGGLLPFVATIPAKAVLAAALSVYWRR